MIAALRLVPALILAAALAACATARAGEPEAIATAPSVAAGPPPVAPDAAPAAIAAQPSAAAPSVAEQIDNYLKTSPALAPPREDASGVTSGDEPRTAHGMVDVAVGSNGYRSAFVRSDLPVGKTGTLSIAVGKSRFDGNRFAGRYGGPFVAAERQSLALGLYLGGYDAGSLDPRCRRAWNYRADMSADPRIEGGRQSPCRTAEPPSSAPQ